MLKRILVAINGSPFALNALRHPIELAKEQASEIRAMYVNVAPVLDFPLLGAAYFQRDHVLLAVATQTMDIREAALRAFDAGGVKGDVQIMALHERGKRVADLIQEAIQD